MSRLALRHRVIFLEPPLQDGGPARLERSHGPDGILVLQPQGRSSDGWHGPHLAAWRSQLEQVLLEEAEGDVIAWLGTPAGMAMLEGLPVRLVAYDGTDGSAMTGIRDAQADRDAIDKADLVLSAVPSLWRTHRAVHAHAHCVPNAADVARFFPERVTARCQEYLAAEKLQGHILAPRLGYAGKIDERVDLRLIDSIAAARPDWHLVFTGAVAPELNGLLPRRDNIHWLGEQPDARRPAIVAAWDVCLLPFTVGEATAGLCPAEALECLAAEKPVVSTALPDVAHLFSGAIQIADDADGFIGTCEAALRETPEQREQRLDLAAQCVARYSWDAAARTVERLIDEALERTAEGNAMPPTHPREPVRASRIVVR
jgi:glycosyltransferase involved in cell wall biosynthesis